MSARRRHGRILLACYLGWGAFAIPWLLGCGEPNGKIRVVGEVRFAGAEVAEGTIRFVDLLTGDAEETVIRSGRYTVKLSSGDKRVEIRSFAIVGQEPSGMPGGGQIARREQVLPEKFNTASTITRKIDGSTKTVNFELQ